MSDKSKNSITIEASKEGLKISGIGYFPVAAIIIAAFIVAVVLIG